VCAAFFFAIVSSRYRLENSFIIFVDRKFTTLFERAFTNDFDVITSSAAIACVCRAGNAD